MPDSHYGARHLAALQVDEMEEVPGVIEPAGCMRIVSSESYKERDKREPVRSFPKRSSLRTLL